LQAIIVTLSMGPNGPSDAVGKTNKSLVMSTVRGDGVTLRVRVQKSKFSTECKVSTFIEAVRSLLPKSLMLWTWNIFVNTLQPDRPAIQAQEALLQFFTLGYAPDIYTTYSMFKVNTTMYMFWAYVVFIDLPAPWTAPVPYDNLQYIAYNYFNLADAVLLDANHSLTLPNTTCQPSAPANAHRLCYYIFAPVLPMGWVIYGDATKIVPMSVDRINAVEITPTSVSATATIYANEGGAFTFSYGRLGSDGSVTSYTATCSSSQPIPAQVTLTCDDSECSCWFASYDLQLAKARGALLACSLSPRVVG
jgi:hypothetical protein